MRCDDERADGQFAPMIGVLVGEGDKVPLSFAGFLEGKIWRTEEDSAGAEPSFVSGMTAEGDV